MRFVLLAFGMLGLAGAAPESSPTARVGRLSTRALASTVDMIATSAMTEGPVAGMSIAISQDGVIVLAKGFGFADLETKRPVAAETLFPVCSISKHVAAAAVLALVEAGRVKLADTLGTVLPDVTAAWRSITVRQLLTHTSGLGSYNDTPGWDSLGTRPLSHAEVLARVDTQPLTFEPGAGWRYSNTAFYLAGMVVEKVSGHDYWQYVREQVAPGMRATADVPALERARGYHRTREGLQPAESESWVNPYAGGGLAATASDLVRWEDRLQSGRLLSALTVAAMMAPTRLADDTQIDYGLGTRLGTFEGHRVVGHTGNGSGFNNVLVHYPSEHLTIAVLTNSESRVGARAIESRIARRVLGLAPYAERDLPVPAAIAAAATGEWTDGSARWAVIASGNRLRFRPEGRDEQPLPYRGNQRFALGPDYEVRFLTTRGRAMWSETYGAGLFDEAQRRVR